METRFVMGKNVLVKVQILLYLYYRRKCASVKEIVKSLEVKESTVRSSLWRLARKGIITVTPYSQSKLNPARYCLSSEVRDSLDFIRYKAERAEEMESANPNE